MFVLFLNWDLKYTGLMMNFGPVPFVPWGTSRRFGRSKNTQREGFYCPGLSIGSRSKRDNNITCPNNDTSGRAKKARPLVVGERCHVLGPGNKWIDTFVTGVTDSGRSYETQVEATGKQLTRNRSHIRPRRPDIPHIHASFLQRNVVPSATSDGNAPSERENLVISGRQQLANGQKMVLSINHKGSIKQTNTSQVLVSETVPDRRVQPSRQVKMTRFGDNPVTSTVPIPSRRQPGHDTSTRNRREFKLNMTDPDLLIPIKQTRVNTRHLDLREPQPSSSNSQPACI